MAKEFKKMKPNSKLEYKPTLDKHITNKLSYLLKLPLFTIKRYASYNAAIGEMLNITKKHEAFHPLRVRNSKLVNLFVYLPFAIGLIIFGLILFPKQDIFINYYNTLFHSFPDNVSFFTIIKILFHRIYYGFSHFPLGFNAIKWVIYGYIGSILGSTIILKHPAFKAEEDIQKVFVVLGLTDLEGKPWKVVWTPDSLTITSFNCDPDKFVENNKFWSSINFNPSSPFKISMSKFVVLRKQELPESVEF